MKALGKSPDSKFILTDGTGYCNYAVLSRLRDKFNWDRIPSAIQFRMFGAKVTFFITSKQCLVRIGLGSPDIASDRRDEI